MLKLIENEYIKLLKRKSTLIWIIGVLVISIGFLCAVKYGMIYLNNEYSGGSGSNEEYTERIEYNQSAKGENYQNEIEYYEKLIEYKLYSYDWRMEALDYAYRTCAPNLHAQNANVEGLDALASTEEGKIGEAGLTNDGSSEEAGTIDTGLNVVNTIDYQKLFDDLCEAVKNNDWKAYLKCKAFQHGDIKYTFEDSKDAINNIYQYMYDNAIEPDFESYEYNTLVDLDTYQSTLEESQGDATMVDEYNAIKEEYLKNIYIINHDFVKTVDECSDLEQIAGMPDNVWRSFKFSETMIMLISVFMVIIAGGIVASEYSTGTIKFLLINPTTRTKIIFAKLLTVLSFTFLATAGFFITNFIASLFLGGFRDMSSVYLMVEDNAVSSMPAFLLMVKEYLYAMVEVLVMATMAFAISSLFKKSSMSTGIGVACLIGGSTINQIFALLSIDWGRYLIFANTDLMSIKNGTSYFVGHTVTGAIINLALHMIVFIFVAHDAFVRREV